MKILLVYANPSSHSLGARLKEAFLKGAGEGGHSVQVLDLYAECFNPVLSEAEEHGGHPPEVERHQAMIKTADWLVFLFPVWWMRGPAILEGWFDRVLAHGFAYHYKSITKTFGIPIGMLKGKKALAVCTYGSPGWAMQFLFWNLPWKRLKRGILKFCGLGPLKHFPCYSAPYASEAQKEQWCFKLQKLARGLK